MGTTCGSFEFEFENIWEWKCYGCRWAMTIEFLGIGCLLGRAMQE